MRSSQLLSALTLLLVLMVPRSALAYTLATTGGDDPQVLRWVDDTMIDGRIPYRLHMAGSDELDFPLFSARTRQAAAAWAAVEGADVSFVQGPIFAGSACPAELANDQGYCGAESPERADEQSALYFVEQGWPYDVAVIALTIVSFTTDGWLVDCDIAFNGVDWDWTAGDDAVVTDYLAIVTHELGHFLGLDHSDVEGATMSAVYASGDTWARSIEEDDAEGLAVLYPCGSPPCVGEVVTWDGGGSGCSAAGSRAAGLLLILGLGALFAVELRRRRAAFLVPMLAGAFLLAPAAESSSVQRLELGSLLDGTDAVLRGTVLGVEPYRAGRIVRSRITVDVTERWRGPAPARITLDQPGGLLSDYGSKAFGMPSFTVGEDVVLFLSWPLGDQPQVRGLAQGKVHVAASGALSRDLSGLSMLRQRDGVAVVPVALPDRLELLRAAVVGAASRSPGP